MPPLLKKNLDLLLLLSLRSPEKRQVCQHLHLSWKLFPGPIEDEKEEEEANEDIELVASKVKLVVNEHVQVDEITTKKKSKHSLLLGFILARVIVLKVYFVSYWCLQDEVGY